MLNAGPAIRSPCSDEANSRSANNCTLDHMVMEASPYIVVNYMLDACVISEYHSDTLIARRMQAAELL